MEKQSPTENLPLPQKMRKWGEKKKKKNCPDRSESNEFDAGILFGMYLYVCALLAGCYENALITGNSQISVPTLYNVNLPHHLA